MLSRIAITGPECTGKTWLAKKLAAWYKTEFVPEYAVEYLTKKGMEYNVEDILKIARGQLYAENKLAGGSIELLFCDTDLLVSKVWSQVVFGQVPEWIEKKFEEHRYDLYLLCFPDIAWRPGQFRENPSDRYELFRIYEAELLRYKHPYRVIKGEGNQRFQNALTFVKEIL